MTKQSLETTTVAKPTNRMLKILPDNLEPLNLTDEQKRLLLRDGWTQIDPFTSSSSILCYKFKEYQLNLYLNYTHLCSKEFSVKKVLLIADSERTVAFAPLVEIFEQSPLINNNFKEAYEIKPLKQPPNTVRVPILMYHIIGDPPPKANQFKKELYVTEEIFEEQMAYLLSKNYKTLSSKEFLEILKSGKNPEQKSVLLTFDDGHISNYENAFRILKKYGLKGTFYIITKKMKISPAQLKEMSTAGMDIEPHSATHRDLRKIKKSELYSEIVTPKLVLDGITGENSVSFCYPGCVYNSDVLKQVIGRYGFAVSCGTRIDHYPRRRFAMHRLQVFSNMNSFKYGLSGYLKK